MTLSKPSQYIKGWVEFYKLKFKVTPDVLIPRPETELLIDEILRYFTLYALPFTLIDVGTGSGNIAISIARNTTNIKIIATDISEKALKIARQNAKAHNVTKKITFLKSNLLKNFSFTLNASRFPLIIVANLPYIPSARIPYLDSSVKDHEPKIALDGGPDGFNVYRKLFVQMSAKKLIPKLFVGEIDYTQGQLAVNEAQKYFPDAGIAVKHDLAKKQRILVIHRDYLPK